MSLDFNTLEIKKGAVEGKAEATPFTVGFDPNRTGEDKMNSVVTKTAKLKWFIPILIGLCTLMSLLSLVFSLLSIKNLPKPEPVLMTCDPDLLQKIEKQAQILDEIAKSSKTQK